MNVDVAFGRRQALKGMAGIGLAVALAPKLSFAQEASSPAADGTEATRTKFNLNIASGDQYLTIPGVGDRMVNEFNEYRPYTTIDQFRREIGKYVEDDVVAGYEHYVFVPIDPTSADADTIQQLPGVVADEAAQLAAGVPYADDAAFLAALAQVVSPAQAALAPAFLTSANSDATWSLFNLNTASGDQFQTIPGVGDRMVDEFNEYRPYTTIEQFRQEIGKYVDDSQVAAYEAYVFVPVDPNQADAATLEQLPGVDEDKANALIAARPFADVAAFLTALGQQVSSEQAAAANAFLAMA